MKTLYFNSILVVIFSLPGSAIKSQNAFYTDARDALHIETYPIQLIGNQLWMAKNLNFETNDEGSKYYNNDPTYSNTYGKLYDWETAKNVCPSGWHLPTDLEFQRLEMNLGMREENAKIFGERCCASMASHFNSGFNGLLGGLKDYKQGDVFLDLNSKGYFWTASLYDNLISNDVISRYINNSNPLVGRIPNSPQNYESVRCLYNENIDITPPVIEINSLESIQTTGLICNGRITYEGSVPITEVGICLSMEPNPTIESSPLQGQIVDGSFQLQVENLTPGILYYIRAYAKYAYGTLYYDITYSNERSVKTLPDPLPDGDYIIDSRDGNSYRFKEIGLQTWLIDNLAFYTTGSYPWIETDYDESGNLINIVHEEDGWFYQWSSAMDIDKKYSQNSLDYFDATYPHQGVCPTGWHIPSNDEWLEFEQYVENSGNINELINDFNWTGSPCERCSNQSIGVGFFSSTQTILSFMVGIGIARFDMTDDPVQIDGTWPRHNRWRVRCIKNDGNSNLPIIELNSISTSNDMATATIYLVNEGNSNVESVGLEWRIAPNLTSYKTGGNDLLNVKSSDSNGQIIFEDYHAGTFEELVGGLLPNTTYYIRAFATNKFGTSYSDEIVYINKFDNNPPVISPPEDITVNNDPGKCSAMVVLTTPEVYDDYGVQSITNDAPVDYPLGITTVTWSALDVNGNESTAKQFVMVINEAPVLNSIYTSSDPVQLESTINVSASFVDNNLEDALWAWGDGTTSNGTVISAVYGEHSYSQPGVYTVQLQVSDACGEMENGTFQYVVVYSPEDGFVTGGGWINSPAGASAQFPDAVGKANFGFESKYKKGASIPSGNTEFQFKAGKLDFRSTLYDWLVIAGQKAMFKGAGTINQSGDYGFILSALDGNLRNPLSADRFRITIWDKQNNDLLVYDNEMATNEYADPTVQIAGGSIVIHNPTTKSAPSHGKFNELDMKDVYFEVFPNPFNNTTFINLRFSTNENIALMLFDINGKLIKDLYKGDIEAGINYTIDYTPDNGFENGIYLLKMITGENQVYFKRIVFNK
jgi:uncharacterized protein (TIGR02145 family)